MSKHGLVVVLVLANLALCALAFLSFRHIEHSSSSVMTMVNDVNETLEAQEYTGLVFRFEGGAVELAQKVEWSMEEFVAKYQEAVRLYLAGEGR